MDYFSLNQTRMVDEILSKLTKNICKFPNNKANFFTHLKTKGFGINTTCNLSCIGQQLIQALSTKGN